MDKAIETLEQEHRLIERVLGSLETFAADVASGEEADRQTVREYAEFFRNFADKCHHGKEEDRLFVKMNQFGFPKEYGPIAVMLTEHVEGRKHVGVLADIGAGSGPLTSEERDSVVAHSRGYIPLLRSHILKEDNILYPMAAQTLPKDEMTKLFESFEAFEIEIMGTDAHERLHALAEKLIESYPPNPANLTQGESCAGCLGHM